MRLFRKRDNADDLRGEALAAQIVERALAVPVENSNPQTEAVILAGPVGVFGSDAFAAMPEGDKVMAVSCSWLGYGLRSAETQLLKEARDYDNPSWGRVGELVTEIAKEYADAPPVRFLNRTLSAEDQGVSDAAARFSGDGVVGDIARGELFGSVPGLDLSTRTNVIWKFLDKNEGRDDTNLSRADRENMIAYGFAVAAAREYLIAHERAWDQDKGREPRS